MAERLLARPVNSNDTWQVWFEVDGDLHSDTMTFLKLRANSPDYIEIDTNVP